MGKIMQGELLEAYVALSKAYFFLDYIKNKHGEREIEELKDAIVSIQRKIYELGAGE